MSAPRSGAGGNHGIEIAIEGEPERTALQVPPSRLADDNVGGVRHGARSRRPPFKRANMAQGIKSAGIGLDQRVNRQIREMPQRPSGSASAEPGSGRPAGGVSVSRKSRRHIGRRPAARFGLTE